MFSVGKQFFKARPPGDCKLYEIEFNHFHRVPIDRTVYQIQNVPRRIENNSQFALDWKKEHLLSNILFCIVSVALKELLFFQFSTYDHVLSADKGFLPFARAYFYFIPSSNRCALTSTHTHKSSPWSRRTNQKESKGARDNLK